MAKKQEILTEKQIDELFIIAAGFNITSDDGSETRFDAGTEKKPKFVTEKDFTPAQWKSLRQMGAVQVFEKPETESEKEAIVFEQIGESE